MNILVVGDDENFVSDLTSKLVFLRKNDFIIKSDYKKVQSNIVLKQPDVILVCENEMNDETIDIIKIIRRKTNCAIVLVAREENPEFILNAYDIGVDDFVTVETPDYELVIRIINNVKYNTLNQKNKRFIKIFEQMKIVDEFSGVFNYNFAKQVIENYIDALSLKDGVFMVVSPSNESKTVFSTEDFANAVKSSVRNDDIITLGKGVSFYIFMPNTDLNGAIFVLNKIKDKLSYDICAGISDISDKNFDKFEYGALKAMAESLALNSDYTLAKDEQTETLDDWLVDKSVNDFKLFRQMFNKKLEKVITPVFYRLQQTYEEKLFDTKIEQYVDENRCEFNLKSKKGDSSLKIIYPGFGKITILINHEGLDSPENREIKLPLAKVTQKELVEIIENFIKEYKENVIG